METVTERPTPKFKKKETHSSEFPVEQKESITLPPIDQAYERDADVVVTDEKALHHDYLAALAFNEEPIKIVIERSNEKFPPRCIDIWCGGLGAEIFETDINKWVRYGALPVGVPIVTRRKYVEILAGSKVENVTADYRVPNPNEDPVNRVDRSTSVRASFSVLEDRNPMGREWLARLIGKR